MSSRAVCVLALVMAGCGAREEPALPATPRLQESEKQSLANPANVLNAANGLFDVAILVPPLSRAPSPADLAHVFEVASGLMSLRTGERMRLAAIANVEGGPAAAVALAYAARQTSNPPEGIVILSEDIVARAVGSYALTVMPSFGFRNEFRAASVPAGRDGIYVAVIHYAHVYARCGYDSLGVRVSDVSVGGECRGRPGSACVIRDEGYMCADAVNDLYAQHEIYRACAIVQSLVRPFGVEGVFDNYGTSSCRARTGMTLEQAGDVYQSQLHCGLCPDLFPRFRRTL